MATLKDEPNTPTLGGPWKPLYLGLHMLAYVLINGALLANFGMSLVGGGTPFVERLARMMEGSLSSAQVRYCRSVTKMWCGFFLLNGFASLWLALFGPIEAWGLYTGGIAYVLMGVLFATEYAVRRIRFG